jgi:hypothetical protein
MKNSRMMSGIAAMRIHVSVFGTFHSITDQMQRGRGRRA